MNTLRAVGVIAVLMCCLSGFVAASAFAENEWLVDGAPVGEASKVHVEKSGTIVVKDLKSGVGLECSVSGLGFVWEKFGEFNELIASSCKTIEGSCGSPNFVPKNLTWLTELELRESEVRNRILNGGKGVPGWDVTCFGFIEDSCSGEAGETKVENMPGESPEDVLEHFTQGSVYTCTLGGANSGEIKGEMLVAALEGLALAASEAEEGGEKEWLVDGALVGEVSKVHVEKGGTIVVKDLKAGLGIECSVSGLGFVWERFGEFNELAPSSCKTIQGSCGAPNYVPKNLTWLSELELRESEVRNRILNGGKGVPGWDVTCFGFIEDSCSGEAGETKVENMPGESPEDVLEHFTQGSVYTCTLGGANSGEIKGEMLVAALEGLALAVT